MADEKPAEKPAPSQKSDEKVPAPAASPAAPAPAPAQAPAAPVAPAAPAAPEPVSSSAKTDEEASAQAEGHAETVSRGVQLDHGDPDPRVEAEHKARLEAAQDPWGTTPMQMRDQHDEAVDPAKVGIATRPDGTGLVAQGAKAPYDGLDPDAVGKENEPQGTLPPV